MMGLNPGRCDQVIKQIEGILPAVNKLSASSWRRMQAEMWLGEMAAKCLQYELASHLINAAKEKSKAIYSDGSDGQS